MTLTIFEDAKGLWICDGGEDGVVPFERSSVDVSVTDGSGNLLDGTLCVNGTPFSVLKGRCKILTEGMQDLGYGTVEFVNASGVKRECSSICHWTGKGWYFTPPDEAFSSDEIVLLLRRMERLREKLASAKSLCSETVSGVLGI